MTAVATQDHASSVVRVEGGRVGVLRPISSAADILAAQNATRELIAATLQADRDYGVIPGTNKPTLLKPGAERICLAFGLTAEYDVAEQEVDHDRPVNWVKRSWKWGKAKGEKVWFENTGTSLGLYRYVVRCSLRHRDSGVVVATGIGSCSTMESKYIDRPRDLENTVLKMGQKRAFIAATLNAAGLSDQFTQDAEDMDLGATPAATDTPAVARDATPAPAPAPRSWTVDDANAVEFPLGRGVVKPLRDVESKRVEAYVKWCREQGRTSGDAYNAGVFILNARTMGDADEPTKEPKTTAAPDAASVTAEHVRRKAAQGDGGAFSNEANDSAVDYDLTPKAVLDQLDDLPF